MWQLFSEPTLSSRLCLMLLHSLWQATLFAVAANVVGRLWRRRSVERDYGFQVVALLASVVAMPVTFASVSVVRPHATEGFSSSPPAGVSSSESDRLRNSSVSVDATRTPQSTTKASRLGDLASPDNHQESNWVPLAPWVAVLYGLGVVLMLARLAAGVWQANRLDHRGQILRDGPLVELVQAMAAKWSMSVVPVLVRVDEIVIPKVVGLVWPKILLPASALTGLSVDELQMILIHELAHLRRHDMWVNLLQRLAEAVLFFNPAAWYLTRRIRYSSRMLLRRADLSGVGPRCPLSHGVCPRTAAGRGVGWGFSEASRQEALRSSIRSLWPCQRAGVRPPSCG